MGVLKQLAAVTLGISITSMSLAVDDIDDQNIQDQQGYTYRTETVRYASDRIIVRYRSDVVTTAYERNNFNQQIGVDVVSQFRQLNNFQIVQSNGNATVEELLAAYQNNPAVLYAERDYLHQYALVPDDTRFGEMWSLNNTGQTGGTTDADINAVEAWELTTGNSSVVVAVLDSGVDITHPDLVDNIWINPGETPGDGIDNDGNGYIDDINGIDAFEDDVLGQDDVGHGTHVAGTIGATGNNTLGVTGVNWDVSIINCKVGGLIGIPTADAIECIDYILDLKVNRGIDVVLSNNSWGGGPFSAALRDAIAANETADILFIAAAGNHGGDNDAAPHYPSSYESSNIIAVASTDHNDNIAFTSGYGASSVDIGAPGVNILSTVPTACATSICDASGYNAISGTSMATPHVSGLAALLKSQDPSRTGTQIKNLLITSGTTIPALDGITLSGKRIRAADLNGAGALTCSGQLLEKKVLPGEDSIAILNGDSITLQYTSIDCDSANTGTFNATFQPSGTIISLLDNGIAPDIVAGDGVFTASFTPPEEGIISFPDGDTVEVNLLANYRPPLLTSFQPRTISSPEITRVFSNVPAEDFEYTAVPSIIPIHFGNINNTFTNFDWGSDGYIVFNGSNFGTNTSLPRPTVDSLIAPFWDDLNTQNNSTSIGYIDVQGVEPDRELVIEFNNFPHENSTTDTATFQIVFFENRTDILFNYIDVQFGDVTVDNGASATVGVQVHSTLAQEFSFNTASLVDEMSLLWLLDTEEPHSDAGDSQIVNFGDAVTIDGSNSSDAQTSIDTFLWEQVNGTTVTLNSTDQMTASFTAPAVAGGMVFRLTVTDTDGNSNSDTTTVIVNDPPAANAGNDSAVNFGDAVNLNSLSTDSDGTIVSYSWTQTAGTAVTLANSNTANASFVASNTPETLSFELSVTDNDGASGTASVNVRVNDPPVADAGAAQAAAYASNVTLDGTASSDSDGTIANYSWTQVAGTAVTLSNTNSANPTFNAPSNSETLSFELSVTDNDGGMSGVSSVDVTVTDIPTADAGTDQLVNVGDSVTLSGSGSDNDGTVDSYRWIQTGGNSVSLDDPTAATTTFTAPSAGGSLTFDLIVTDDAGLDSIPSSVEVYVNSPPAINMGASQTVRVGNAVTLSAVISDSDGTVDSISWAQTSGPSATLSSTSSATTDFTPGTPGTYVFQVTATDNDGGVNTATTTITVNKKKSKSGGALGTPALIGLLIVLGLMRRRRLPV